MNGLRKAVEALAEKWDAESERYARYGDGTSPSHRRCRQIGNTLNECATGLRDALATEAACPCGCPAEVHIGETGCACALPGEPPCAPLASTSSEEPPRPLLPCCQGRGECQAPADIGPCAPMGASSVDGARDE